MKIETYKVPHSSFLSVEKDLMLISNQIIKNRDLQKLLFYTTKDCLKRQDLSIEETLTLFNKNVKIVPKATVDREVLNYIIVNFDNFTPSGNPEFRDNLIEFDIICHYDQWQIDDNKLRPYQIAGQLDSMFNGAKLTGIGELEFFTAGKIVLNDEFAGICLLYKAVHGNDDKINPANPVDEEQIIENFNEIFNA